MIDPRAVMAVALFGCVASVTWSATIAWVHWLRHKSAESLPPSLNGTLSPDNERLAQLESAVDVLSVELERMAEAQRYTIRLLDERLPAQIPAASRQSSSDRGRSVTPH